MSDSATPPPDPNAPPVDPNAPVPAPTPAPPVVPSVPTFDDLIAAVSGNAATVAADATAISDLDATYQTTKAAATSKLQADQVKQAADKAAMDNAVKLAGVYVKFDAAAGTATVYELGPDGTTSVKAAKLSNTPV